MADQPRVTWLMPVRNGMPYLPLTLETIVAQSFSNQQILVWDNGSTDGTLAVLDQWIPSRLPGTVVRNRPLPLGLSLAALVEQADTELCARIDADDLNTSNRLEKQVQFLSAHPEVGVVGAASVLIDQHGHRLGDWVPHTDDAELRWASRWQGHLCHPSVLFRRAAVLAAGNYRDVDKAEDLDLWVRLGQVAELRNMPEKLLSYRRTDTSVTGRVTDYIPNNRDVAERNTAILFPNIGDPAAAMELWEATHPQQTHLPMKWRFGGQLKQAAISLARQLQKPDDYFLNTNTYHEQAYHFRRRIMQRAGLGRLLDLRRLFAGTSIQS